MPLYEHVMIARQDISTAQAEELIAHFGKVLTDNGGSVVGTEYWGLRTMAYKINRNRKGHYGFFRIDAPSEAVREMERLMRLHDDVVRGMTIKVRKHDEGPSPVVLAKHARDERERERERSGRPRRSGDRRDERDPGEDGRREYDGGRKPDGERRADGERTADDEGRAEADAKDAEAKDAGAEDAGAKTEESA